MVTRRDLTPAQQAVQSIHAAIESARSGLISPTIPHPHLVYCGVKNELALQGYAEKLSSAGIALSCFYEPDRNNELTAIATGPIHGDQRRLFRNLQLIKEQPNVS